jgi:hypothetical protein
MSADSGIMSKKKQERVIKIVAIAIVLLFFGTAVAVAISSVVS